MEQRNLDFVYAYLFINVNCRLVESLYWQYISLLFAAIDKIKSGINPGIGVTISQEGK